MAKNKKKWKIVAIITGITGAVVGAVILFKDKIVAKWDSFLRR